MFAHRGEAVMRKWVLISTRSAQLGPSAMSAFPVAIAEKQTLSRPDHASRFMITRPGCVWILVESANEDPNGHMTENGKKKVPVLSLILCSRNDEYMGNSRWRLETTLNYVADQVEALGRGKEVEVLVADWGSEIPLREVLRLTPAAAQIVSFILIPPEVARSLQKDSPFPEVLALNAVARRARGEYIGRIDQDTLVGRHFLEVFFDLYDGRRHLAISLDRALLYSNRRAIPYWFAVRCPAHQHVDKFIRLLGQRCGLETLPNREFWTYAVGIWLIHRDLWTECGGYDERFIYYNWMEVEMILRLRQRYTLIDFGEMIEYDFYHLNHWNPRASLNQIRRDLGHQENTFDLDPNAPSLAYHPNSDAWGLAEFKMGVDSGLEASPPREGWFDNVVFAALVTCTRMQLMLDKTYWPWITRADKAWAALRGVHPLSWPRVLMELWARKSGR